MNLFQRLRGVIMCFFQRKPSARTVPDGYFKGYRRLAGASEEVVGQHCYNCRHAVGYVSWWCDRGDKGCQWEKCHVATEITKEDLKSGGERWVRLPTKNT